MINTSALERGREAFMRGYVEAILWADTFVERPGEDESETRDVTYWFHTPGRWWEDTPVALEDAAEFWDRFAYVILSLDYGPNMAGFDFALTRNSHGAGYWDRGMGTIGDMLTDEAMAYGSHSVYISVDDNDDILSTYNN